MRIKLLMAFLGCLPVLTGAALAAAPVTLVENGKPAATIVIADEPTVIPAGERILLDAADASAVAVA